jgi:hypothetical protein
MYISHPIGPRNITIINQPILGPIGHLDPFFANHEPPLDENMMCAIGNKKPTIKNIQAAIGLI